MKNVKPADTCPSTGNNNSGGAPDKAQELRTVLDYPITETNESIPNDDGLLFFWWTIRLICKEYLHLYLSKISILYILIVSTVIYNTNMFCQEANLSGDNRSKI